MNIYHYLKVAASSVLPSSIKLLGLWGLYVCKRRMIGLFLDPVMACNLRCQMCYMSDKEKRSEMKGEVLTDKDIERISNAFYSRVLKLQIGCATEPTLFPRLPYIISEAKQRGVPYISLTSNGKLIASGRVSLIELADCGLNELTLSMHGTTQDVYETLMQGANYSDLRKLPSIVKAVKLKHPDFKLRVNYTVNTYNLQDLEGDKFWSLWENGALPDIIQLRPVQDMGDTVWQNFDITPLKERYDVTFGAIAAKCKQLGIQCIAPTLKQLDEVATDQDGTSTILSDLTYCYVSPKVTYKPDFMDCDTYDTYHQRIGTGFRLLRSAFVKNSSSHRNVTKHLNYKIG